MSTRNKKNKKKDSQKSESSQYDFFDLLEFNNYKEIERVAFKTNDDLIETPLSMEVSAFKADYQPIQKATLVAVQRVDVNSNFIKKLEFLDSPLEEYYITESLRTLFNRGVQRNWARKRGGKYLKELGGDFFCEEAESQAILKTLEYFNSYKRSREYYWLLEKMKDPELKGVEKENTLKRINDLMAIIVNDSKTAIKPLKNFGALQGYSVVCFKNHYNNEIRSLEKKEIPSDQISLSYIDQNGEKKENELFEDSDMDKELFYKFALKKIDDLIFSQKDPDLWVYHQAIKDNSGGGSRKKDFKSMKLSKDIRKVEIQYNKLVKSVRRELDFSDKDGYAV